MPEVAPGAPRAARGPSSRSENEAVARVAAPRPTKVRRGMARSLGMAPPVFGTAAGGEKTRTADPHSLLPAGARPPSVFLAAASGDGVVEDGAVGDRPVGGSPGAAAQRPRTVIGGRPGS